MSQGPGFSQEEENIPHPESGNAQPVLICWCCHHRLWETPYAQVQVLAGQVFPVNVKRMRQNKNNGMQLVSKKVILGEGTMEGTQF